MPETTPPYALAPTYFPFPALVSYAGRAPLGGDREMALGVLMAARLASALIPPAPLDRPTRAGRAKAATQWITGLAMPQPARMALIRAFDASVTAPAKMADALVELAQTVTGHIDNGSQYELAALVERLRQHTVIPAAEKSESVAEEPPAG